MSATPIVSFYSATPVEVKYDQVIPIDKILMPPTVPNVLYVRDSTVHIRQSGLYEVTFTVSTKSGGNFGWISYPGSMTPAGIIKDSSVYINPNTTATNSFQFRAFYAADLGFTNRNQSTLAPVTLDLQNNNPATVAVFIKRVSN